MTEAKDTADPNHSKGGSDIALERHERRRARLADVERSLQELDAADFTDVLFRELDRRRLDGQGNQTEPEGLYIATTTGLLALLGLLPKKSELQEQAEINAMSDEEWLDYVVRRRRERGLPELKPRSDDDPRPQVGRRPTILGLEEQLAQRALAERIAAVGRGQRLARESDASDIREVSGMVEAMLNTPPEKIDPSARAPMLAKTLEKRFGHAVNAADIELALARPSHNGRVADVVIAAGIVSGKVEDELFRRDLLRQVALALKE
jgi:hypothetical protein